MYVCRRTREGGRESIAQELELLQEHIWQRGKGDGEEGTRSELLQGDPPFPGPPRGREPGQPVVTCPTLMKPYLLAMRSASGKPPAILTAQWLV